MDGHVGSDGSQVSTRIQRYLKDGRRFGENLQFGTPNALEVIIDLIVDDDVPDRGHRKSVFNSAWEMNGVFTGKHTVYDFMSCLNHVAGSA